MVDFLVSEAGVGPETAVSMIRFIAAKREEYRPCLSTIEPGHALSIAKEKRPFMRFGGPEGFSIGAYTVSL